MLWGETVGTLPRNDQPRLPSEPTSSLHACHQHPPGPWAALPLASRMGSGGPASFDPASGLASAAGWEGSGPQGTHTCFHRVWSSPWGQAERVHRQGRPGLPFSVSC